MKKSLFILGLLFYYTINTFSPEADISLRLTSVVSENENIKISFEFENTSEKDIAVYIPDSADICRQILKIKFVSTKDSTVHTYEPCIWYADTKLLKLDCNNSMVLAPKEKKVIYMNLLKKEIFPKLKQNTSYSISLELYLKDAIGESVFVNYFDEDIVSNSLVYKN